MNNKDIANTFQSHAYYISLSLRITVENFSKRKEDHEQSHKEEGSGHGRNRDLPERLGLLLQGSSLLSLEKMLYFP